MFRNLCAVLGLSSLLFKSSYAQAVNCGTAYQNAICEPLGPCCSEFGFCGSSPAQCGGGCDPKFSLDGACLSSRVGGQKCYSGLYRFGDNSTWIIPSDAYNGNPQAADFTIDRLGLEAGNYKISKSGLVRLELTQNPSGNARDAGVGTRLSSTSYITSGSRVTVRMRPSSAGGVVSAFITMADDKDEIDWEWTGDPTYVSAGQSNFFSKGVVDYTNSQRHFPGGARTPNLINEFHEYGLDWNEQRLLWLIDGQVVRTVTAAQLGATYPKSPARVQFAVWDGGAMSAGTRLWAGGYVDWTTPLTTRSMIIEWIKIQCSGDPEPLTPPARPPGFYAPYIYAPPVNSVIEGVGDYNANYTGAGKKSIANVATETVLNPKGAVDNTGKKITIDTEGKVVPVTTNVATNGSGRKEAYSFFGILMFSLVALFL
ncbi:hypothetical protein HK098_002320 [Nowakowskiella sp. JEL0407]|nr:hypothetical protein HK098_002320 [Nowakowskiella sp. JEL0407]